ncbi:MFS transporter [Sphingopyxis sp. PET50]|uniref:MFS transporter n=1 Tax=Sphingopyxis sp. PET50 TaxID=2976533 RepID=UPI0021B08031|nr:MFS transporter [Sphingopyxis sp. PET50]
MDDPAQDANRLAEFTVRLARARGLGARHRGGYHRGAGCAAIGVFMRGLQADFGWTRAEISLGPTILIVTLAAIAPLLGWLADRAAPRLIVGTALAALAAGLFLFSRLDGDLRIYYAGFALLAIAASGSATIVYAKLLNATFHRNRGAALGLAMVGNGATGILLPLLLVPYAAVAGWRAGFIALAAVVALALPLVVLLIGGRRDAPVTAVLAAPPGDALRSRAFRIMAICFALIPLAVAGLHLHFLAYLADMGIGPSRAGAIAGVGGAALMAARILTGFLIDHIFAPHVAAAMMMFSAAAIAGMVLLGPAAAVLGAVALGVSLGAELDLIGYMTARYFGLDRFGRIYGILYGVVLAKQRGIAGALWPDRRREWILSCGSLRGCGAARAERLFVPYPATLRLGSRDVNIALVLDAATRLHPDRTAISWIDRPVWTYAELWERAVTLAAGFAAMGLRPGDRVVMAMSNAPAYCEVLLGAWIAGLVPAPQNCRLHAAEIGFAAQDCGARLCIATADLAAPLAAAIDGLCPLIDIDSADFAALHGHGVAKVAPRAPTDAALLFYTSGTTGKPKAAIHTHRTLNAMLVSFLADSGAVVDDHILHIAPMSHASGFLGLSYLARGRNNIVLPTGAFEPELIARAAAAFGPLSFFAVPTIVRRLTQPGILDEATIAGIHRIFFGGAPMYVEDLKRAIARFGSGRLWHLYGQGETPNTITHLPPHLLGSPDDPDYADRLASVGVARSGVSVRILRDDGAEARSGEVGEVVVQGDTLMAELLGSP